MTDCPTDQDRLRQAQEWRHRYDTFAAIAAHPRTPPHRRHTARLGMAMELAHVRVLPYTMAPTARVAAHIRPGKDGQTRALAHRVAAAHASLAYHEAKASPASLKEAQEWREVIVAHARQQHSQSTSISARL